MSWKEKGSGEDQDRFGLKALRVDSSVLLP